MGDRQMSSGFSRGPRGRRVLKLELWPDLDRLAWKAAGQRGGILDPRGLASAWTPATRNNAIQAYGRWLSFLGERGCLSVLAAPADRVTETCMNEYIADLQQRSASTTVVTYIAFLGCALRAMAPDDDWVWLSGIIAGLKKISTPVRDKRPHLQPSDELVAFGCELMDVAESASAVTTWQQSTQYRDGMMIALIAACPLRRSNFCSIEIGRQLVSVGGTYRLTFDRTETKNKKAIAFLIPAELEPYLTRYLAHYRPWLLRQTSHRNPAHPFNEPGARLWVSKTGSAMSAEVFYKGLLRRTTERFGHHINPHLFRDCAATTIAVDAPEHVHITAGLLGHSSLRTSERYYNHANSVEATHRLQAEVRLMRQRARRRRGKTRPIHSEA
jgi:integrase/recombinase XerD